MKCVSNIGDVVDDEECNMKLRPSDIENCDMGPCAKSWFLTEWSERVSVMCRLGFLGLGTKACWAMGRRRVSRGAPSHTQGIPRVISHFGEKAQR